MHYRLNVIRRINGKYRVSHSRDMEAENLPDFPALVKRIEAYATERPEVFLEEPRFLGLRQEEEKTIRGIRKLVLETGIKKR